MTDKPELGNRKPETGQRSTGHRAAEDETAPTTDLPVLFVGDASRGEFRPTVAMLQERCDLTVVRDVAAALDESGRAAFAPSLIVVAQTRPGEHSAAELDALRRSAPLAPVVSLLGGLCEGESRSGSPYPGAVRVYWHQWRQRAWQELAALRAARASSWSLPATASDEERLLCSATGPMAPGRGLVAIVSANYEMADWLAGACREQGFAVVRTCVSRPAQSPAVAVVVWDAGLAGEANLHDLAALQAAYPNAKPVVLLDFPRVEDYERLLAAGVAAVLSKPVMLAELSAQLAAASY